MRHTCIMDDLTHLPAVLTRVGVMLHKRGPHKSIVGQQEGIHLQPSPASFTSNPQKHAYASVHAVFGTKSFVADPNCTIVLADPRKTM